MTEDDRQWDYYLIKDEPITNLEEDLFGFSPLAQYYARHIASEKTESPITIGIFGGWGTGKTSLMQLMKSELDNSERVKTVWFNAWEYSDLMEVRSALVYQIITELVETDEERLEHIKNIVKPLLLNFITKKISGMSMKEIQEELLPQLTGISSIPKSVKMDYELLITNLLNEQTKKIVVFIDDLDRCDPKSAVDILRGIRLFFNVEGCVYVMGLDKTMIEQIIESEYTGAISGEDYLEKMFTVPIFVPILNDRNTEDFLRKMQSPLFLFMSERMIQCLQTPREIIRVCNALNVYFQQYEEREGTSLLRLSRFRDSNTEEIDPFLKLAKLVLIKVKWPLMYQIMLYDTRYFKQGVQDILFNHSVQWKESFSNEERNVPGLTWETFVKEKLRGMRAKVIEADQITGYNTTPIQTDISFFHIITSEPQLEEADINRYKRREIL